MIILASKSPRRKQLLKKLVPTFKIIPADVDESKVRAPVAKLAEETSKLKARAVAKLYPNDLVIGCDTVVVYNNQIFGQPVDASDAKVMLKTLSGETHYVISGYTLISNGEEISRSVTSKVTFNHLSDELITAYVASGKPLDKAGSYGIQDEEFALVKKVEGSYDNVMGLPTEDLSKYLDLLKRNL